MASTQSHTASNSDHSYSNSPGSSSHHSPAHRGSRLSRFDSGAPSSSASKTSLSRRAARRSLSLLGSLPKEISALIRSHSSSRRQYPCHQDIYGDADGMPLDDDRPSRKSESGNRLYNFLTRSRSRSRSKNNCAPSTEPDEPVPDLPQSGRARRDSTGLTTPSKPPTRIQSRPLSSTTTATNTTITPGTPRPKKRPPSAIAVPEATTGMNLERSSSRPETPKASSTRKKLHTLFGIPLSSPRKSSFSSSRQGSRRPSIEAPPPLPGRDNHEAIEDDEPTPRPLRSHSPQAISRPGSPSPSPRPKPLALNASSSSTATSSTSASSRLQKFFSGHKAPAPSAPSAENVSGPLRRPSGSLHHRSNSNSSQPHKPSLDPIPPKAKPGTMGPPPVPPPKIINTPATPLRSEPSPKPSATPASHAPRLSQRKNSVDSGYRYHTNATMDIVDEGAVLGRIGSIGKGKEKELGSLSVIGLSNGATRARIHTNGAGHPSRSTKHGSFDFERPGWSATGAIQRSGSNGTTGTGTSGTSGGWGRNTDGHLGGVRESSMGPGLAGVGTLQREASMKRGKEREEIMKRAREEERRRRKGEVLVKEEAERTQTSQRHRSLQPPPRKPESEDNSGKSSSLGKKRGGLLRTGSTGGKGRATALGLAHGLFAFEPPVPSPTRSTGSVGTGAGETPLSVSWGGERGRSEPGREKERVRIKEDLEREREKERNKLKEKQYSSYRGDRAPVPVPGASVGHRSGTKGRSLDLGLGLAWAPTKVREDALLPTSGYFGRSPSGSSSVNARSLGSSGGRSASGSTNGVDEKERSKVGREVAEVFHSALDDDGYAAFKKYVHRFDAHEIPFDGPTGIVSRVEHLLKTAPALSDEGKRRLLDSFVRIILQNA